MNQSMSVSVEVKCGVVNGVSGWAVWFLFLGWVKAGFVGCMNGVCVVVVVVVAAVVVVIVIAGPFL